MNPNPSPQKTPVELLVVEDSRTQALRVQRTLEKHGFRVTLAGNGVEALTVLATLRPALVISDIQMPEMDGYELCHRIKSDAVMSELPVMLLTSLSAPRDIIRALECGADNFVVKPYEEDFLIARVHAVLENSVLAKVPDEGKGMAVEFSGQHYVIDASRRQILNLLMSTYETAIKTNDDLIQAHEELKATQAQLIQAEKLQSVGRLAAGVAHEVRNPSGHHGNGPRLPRRSRGCGGQPPDRRRDAGGHQARERRHHQPHGYFIPRVNHEMREGDIHGVIQKAITVLADELARGKVKVVQEFDPALPLSRMDAPEIEQVFVNLITNALHAMPEGGTITIRTRVGVLDSKDAAFDSGDRSGIRFREGEKAIIVEVSDEGAGITPENLDKVFDPFFSTKPTGRGMGLGLTVCRKLIELHHGAITVRNRPEGGVTATLIFKIR